MLLPVPVTVKVDEPADGFVVLRVNVETAVPFAGGVTAVGLNDVAVLVGFPLALSVTAELNPPRLVIVTVYGTL